jgi:menaquinone-dependent protoporphyrinogen IX oxidase
VPLVREYSQVAQNVIDAWYALCVEYDSEKDGKMTAAVMTKKLESEFLPKQKQILGGDLPH